jgi:hypothetical protein
MLPPEAQQASALLPSERPVVRVLGQYKPDRDVEALRQIAETLGQTARLEICGRGWPPIDGWSVRSEFVDEAHMSALLASSDAVLIPYRRFYQSGIAFRCLEQGTPAVGPAGSSLDEIYGPDSPLLVRGPDDWCRAISHAVSLGRAEAVEAGRIWRARASRAWSDWSQT